MRPTITLAAIAVAAVLIGAFAVSNIDKKTISNAESILVYGEDNALKRPINLESWVFLGTTMGMTYTADEPSLDDPGLFSTVLMEPSSYMDFLETGQFSDGTVFAKVVRDTNSSDGGFSMGDELGIEVHVKDEKRFPKYGFNFYFFPSGGDDFAPAMPEDNGCVSCHQASAEFDDVFTQYYPTMKGKIGNALE